MEIVLVEMNWKTMEYPAYTHPFDAPKIVISTQLNMKTYCHKDLLNLLEKYRAIKSVPPVDAFPFNAMTIAKPYKNPPKATFRIISSSILPFHELSF